MKKITLLFALMLASTAIYAQNDMQARIELEDAEKEYSKHGYTDALWHLDEAEMLLGRWSHQIGYLRIITLDKACESTFSVGIKGDTIRISRFAIIDKIYYIRSRNFFTDKEKKHVQKYIKSIGNVKKGDSSFPYTSEQSVDFTLLQAEVKKYIDYANANADKVDTDKFREVYAISKRIDREKQANAAWKTVNQTDFAALQAFIDQYEGSAAAKYAAELAEPFIKQAEQVKKQAAAWEKIKNTINPKDIEEWFKQFPDKTTAVYREADARHTALKAGLAEMSAKMSAKEWVEINGVKWATRNVGTAGTFVEKPESFGNYYFFAENENFAKNGNFAENKNNVMRIDKKTCPKGWRLPTEGEFESLIKSGYAVIEVNGVKGMRFGTGSNIIFLPAGGRMGIYEKDKGKIDGKSSGYYFSSSKSWEINLQFNDIDKRGIIGAISIRCVLEDEKAWEKEKQKQGIKTSSGSDANEKEAAEKEAAEKKAAEKKAANVGRSIFGVF